MNYEDACAQLYEERLNKQQRLRLSRDKFRQSVLDRQNRDKNIQHNVSIRTEGAPEVGVSGAFTMPDILPHDEKGLKWLVAKNIELKMLEPGRIKEANANIKRIKDFIDEQKARRELPA